MTNLIKWHIALIILFLIEGLGAKKGLTLFLLVWGYKDVYTSSSFNFMVYDSQLTALSLLLLSFDNSGTF